MPFSLVISIEFGPAIFAPVHTLSRVSKSAFFALFCAGFDQIIHKYAIPDCFMLSLDIFYFFHQKTGFIFMKSVF